MQKERERRRRDSWHFHHVSPFVHELVLKSDAFHKGFGFGNPMNLTLKASRSWLIVRTSERVGRSKYPVKKRVRVAICVCHGSREADVELS